MATSFNDLYKQFRNRLRAYQPTSVINRALETLRTRSGDKLKDLQQAPWHVLLIVKWALQDKMAQEVGSREISRAQFDELRQRLWALPEEMGSAGGMSLPLFVRRILHAQIAFQREMSAGFVREAAILGGLPDEHPLKIQFTSLAGLSPDLFIDLALATYPAIVTDRNPSLSFTWFAPLLKVMGPQSLQSFVALVSRDYSELRTFCRALPDQNPRVASEYYESTPLRRFPFFRHADGLECWHEMVFFRGMEGIVHMVLSDAGAKYIEPFSKLFESHVIAEAFSAGCYTMTESDLGSLLGSNSKAPDALLSFPEANIFIESKAGLFDEPMMTVGSREILRHQTKALRSAIAQGWVAAGGVRRVASPPQVKNAPTDYLLIVTNRDLEIGSGVHLKQMYPDGKLEAPDIDSAVFLPLQHIFILSVDEFERLMAAVRQKEVSLPQVLAACVEANADPATAKLFFEQHLTAQRIRRGRSELVSRTLDRSTERVTAALEKSNV